MMHGTLTPVELGPRRRVRRSGARSASDDDGVSAEPSRCASESPRGATDALDSASVGSRTSRTSSTRSSLSEFAFEMELPDSGMQWVPEESSWVTLDYEADHAAQEAHWAPFVCGGWMGAEHHDDASEPARGTPRTTAAHAAFSSEPASRGGDQAANLVRIPSCEMAYAMEMCHWGQTSTCAIH